MRTPGPDAAPELTCQELVELVTEYLEDELPSAERSRFEAHLQDCGPCRSYLHQMRTTIDLVGSLKASDLDLAMERELLRAFRGWKHGAAPA
jgi:anti-sigma factor RsiW